MSEFEMLQKRCQEQERQIHELEEEISMLRDAPGTAVAVKPLRAGATMLVTTASSGTADYTVKAGDSLMGIARKRGTSAEILAKANGLTLKSVIRPGQVLKVPATAAETRKAVVDAPKETAATVDLQPTHKLVQGETFSSISRKYGVSVASLLAANPDVNPRTMRPGLVVNLPGRQAAKPAPAVKPKPAASAEKAPSAKKETPVAKKEEPPVRREEPVAKKEEAAPAKPAAEEAVPRVHPITIETETTYGAFAAKYGTSAERLNALNGLDLTSAAVLAKGSELYVPAE